MLTNLYYNHRMICQNEFQSVIHMFIFLSTSRHLQHIEEITCPASASAVTSHIFCLLSMLSHKIRAIKNLPTAIGSPRRAGQPGKPRFGEKGLLSIWAGWWHPGWPGGNCPSSIRSRSAFGHRQHSATASIHSQTALGHGQDSVTVIS